MARCDVPGRECLHLHVRPHLRSPAQASDDHGRPIDSYRAHCPAHPDKEPSLSISVGRTRSIVWHCFAGCDNLAVRAALIRDGIPADCLPIGREAETELADAITALYSGDISNPELRWRVYSLVNGFGGELPSRGKYPGGVRGFARDAGVSPSDAYGRGVHR